MKALIIENDSNVEQELEEMLRDSPDYFPEYPDMLNHARSRLPAVIGQAIAAHDTIIFQSTFTYTDQLSKLMDGFYHSKFGEKVYTFYVCNILSKLRDWTRPLGDDITVSNGQYHFYARLGWHSDEAHAKFLEHVKEMITTERIILYDLIDDLRGYKPNPDYDPNNKKSVKEIPVFGGVRKRILYSQEYQNFYSESANPADRRKNVY